MKKLIIAHRGASKLAHENTLEAFQMAIDIGADAVEFDVRRTKDGVLVIRHNELLGGKLIRHHTYKEVRKILNRRGLEIPTLEEVLRLTAGKIKLDIELKEAGYEREVIDLTLKYFPPQDFIVTSFLSPVILRIKRDYPQIKAGFLREELFWTVWWTILFWDINYFFGSLKNRREAVARSDFLAVRSSLASRGYMERPGTRGKNFYVYTVDRDDKIKKYLAEQRLIGLITNYPDRALKIREQNYGNSQ